MSVRFGRIRSYLSVLVLVGIITACAAGHGRPDGNGRTGAAPHGVLMFPVPAAADTTLLNQAMHMLAQEVLVRYQAEDRDTYLNTAFRLQMVAGDPAAALSTLDELRALRHSADPRFAPTEYTQYEVFARAQLGAMDRGAPLEAVIREQFEAVTTSLSDEVAYRVFASFDADLGVLGAQLERALGAVHSDAGRLSMDEAIALCRAYHLHRVFSVLHPMMPAILRAAEADRYEIDDAVRIPTRDGNVLSAVVVRPRRLLGLQPAVLEFTIYAGEQNRATAMEAAARGFVGVVANSRGKRASTGPVAPWEHEAADAYDVIDWVSRQPWSNGSVGMIGGSYAGFTQWAAAKRLHPALKTMVPAAAVAPGIDFPRENGVVLNFQYSWAHWVGYGNLLDDAVYRDRARWERLDSTWFARGTAYRALDEIDGVPNPLFRRWLDHPTYDGFWQAMIPQRREYAAISIPVLSITGYFDGAQPGALHYFREHALHHPTNQHTLLIGPWDHFGAQRRPARVLGSHVIDAVARFDVIEVVYAWLEHVLRGGERPAILTDRVNYQVMGTNHWLHASTLAAMATDTLMLHLAGDSTGMDHRLQTPPSSPRVRAEWAVDLTDRTVVSSTFIDPWNATSLDTSNGVAFRGEVLQERLTVCGSFTGELVVTVNVRDVDLAVILYELTEAGEYVQLSYYLGRASLAEDPSKRRLLTPGAPERIPLDRPRIICRVVPAGSRFVAVVNVNKGPQSQINYGSGKDPSDETLADAASPVRIQLHGASLLRIPIRR